MKGSNIMKKGFTLAEVLITLAIIGVVAALTIPSVMLNTNQQEYRSALKKAVSVLNQGVSLRMATENDTPSAMTSYPDLMALISGQMNTIDAQTASGCSIYSVGDNATANGSAYSGTSANCSFTTTDGMQFWFPDNSSLGAALSGTCTGGTGTTKDSCTSAGGSWAGASEPDIAKGCTDDNPCYLVVDVNGSKNPNKFTTTNADGSANVQDRFILSLKGDNGTVIAPEGAGAQVMYK